jgi:hypothetical protein
MRVAVAAAFLLLSPIFTLSAVHALSPAQMDRAISGSSSVMPVAKKTCLSLYKQCLARCKKDTSCKDVCYGDYTWCGICGPMC